MIPKNQVKASAGSEAAMRAAAALDTAASRGRALAGAMYVRKEGLKRKVELLDLPKSDPKRKAADNVRSAYISRNFHERTYVPCLRHGISEGEEQIGEFQRALVMHEMENERLRCQVMKAREALLLQGVSNLDAQLNHYSSSLAGVRRAQYGSSDLVRERIDVMSSPARPVVPEDEQQNHSTPAAIVDDTFSFLASLVPDVVNLPDIGTKADILGGWALCTDDTDIAAGNSCSPPWSDRLDWSDLINPAVLSTGILHVPRVI
jgi:hypothetical protein